MKPCGEKKTAYLNKKKKRKIDPTGPKYIWTTCGPKSKTKKNVVPYLPLVVILK